MSLTSTSSNNDWLPLDSNHVAKFLNSGRIILIKPTDAEAIVPLFCPCCAFPIKTAEDSTSIRTSGVCYPCDLRWYRSNKARWHEEGWRPSGETWDYYLEDREQRSKVNITFS